jgi:cytochrome c
MRICSLALAVLAAAVAPAFAAGDPAAGKRAFARCASCHQVGPSARSVFGPQLNGIIGRHAAAATDYRYSEAMRKSGIVWDERHLAAFLRSPNKAVPGTSMRFWGIGDEKQIADLLAYLRTITLKGDQS